MDGAGTEDGATEDGAGTTDGAIKHGDGVSQSDGVFQSVLYGAEGPSSGNNGGDLVDPIINKHLYY